MGIISVVTENDPISYSAIESENQPFGDNDMLAAANGIDTIITNGKNPKRFMGLSMKTRLGHYLSERKSNETLLL